MRWGSYLARRLLGALVTVWVAATVNFFLFRLLPGDYVSNFARVPGATKAFQEQLRAEFGLDKSLGGQYVTYLWQLLHGNLGYSYQYKTGVSGKILDLLANTVPMVGLSTIIAILIGTLLGFLAAWRKGTPTDGATVLVALVVFALPVQWMGMMLVLWFTGVLPTSGISDPYMEMMNPTLWETVADYLRHMILPSITLLLSTAGSYVLLVRTAVLDTFGEDYVLTARAKGLSKFTILRRHIAPNAMLPTITVIALTLGTVVGGAVLVETVFSWPGIGWGTYQAINNRDYPLLQGIFLVMTVSVIVLNLLADLLYFRLDPRIRK
ncbi:ABC transporter permease [Nocardioides sp. GY 10127]|uniref:ABC transporter permease n=1 Tax=Nocardioides sp. GY 10127 TaxID=2569762 RepID=UPI0010A87ED9|nr:ABC transporter permease [Nocardioides sp. GY 10127]TIC80028.1 ABC transporter permease [Nocardioides sp. GY 10127]